MTSDEKPVLVLGAGINGAAVARELLLNRVPVCLVDRADMGAGATAYSSRLIHGGLRYLEYGEFDLVRQSLDERERLLRLAPQFVRPLRLFIPSESRASGLLSAVAKFLGREPGPAPRGLWLVRLGLCWYDACSRSSRLPGHQTHRAGEMGVPSVGGDRCRWLCSYHDAQIEFPERFVVSLVTDAQRLAAEHGVWFRVLTYHEARLRHDAVELRPVVGDGEPTFTLRPAAIVNATGAWVDRTLARLAVSSPRLMGGTKGSHFVTRSPALREALGGSGVYAAAADGRPVFLLPFGGSTLVGTTELPFDADPETAVASEEELVYLLELVNHTFPHVGLTRNDIDLHYSGVRPLPLTRASTPGAVTRRHRVDENTNGPVPLFSVIGGKLTGCRLLAEETAAVVLERLGLCAARDSRDRVVPGGESYPQDDEAVSREQTRIAARSGFSDEQVKAVWRLCGTRAESMLRPAHDTASVWRTNLPRAFVRRVIRDEWCTQLSDLVERRLMLLYDPDLSEPTLYALAELMTDEGVLAADEVDAQVEACRRRLLTHFGRQLKACRE